MGRYFQGVDTRLVGKVLEVEAGKRLKYSGIDPALADESDPNAYFHVTYIMEPTTTGVLLTVVNETFDGNEERMGHITGGWEGMVFPKLKELSATF